MRFHSIIVKIPTLGFSQCSVTLRQTCRWNTQTDFLHLTDSFTWQQPGWYNADRDTTRSNDRLNLVTLICYWQQRLLRISRKVHLDCRRILALSRLNWSKIMFMGHQGSLQKKKKKVVLDVKERRFSKSVARLTPYFPSQQWSSN
jgi:hypothetical protein